MERMKIWKDAPEALNMSTLVPREFGEFLGMDCRLGLFRTVGGREREVFRCAPRKEHVGWQPVVGFADAVGLTVSLPTHLPSVHSIVTTTMVLL
jgi:hypothetical protein